MTALNSARNRVLFVVLASALLQIALSLHPGTPAWIYPLLTLPPLCLMTWLWWGADKQNRDNQAFARLVI